MIIDRRLQVSAQQALTANANSTDLINLGHTQFIGPGEPLWWVIAARVALAGAGKSFAASVQTDTVVGFGSPTVLQSTGAYTVLDVGQRIILPMTFTNERFLRLAYTVTGTVTIDAFLTSQDPSSWAAFPDAI